jgi:hypothetical protein
MWSCVHFVLWYLVVRKGASQILYALTAPPSTASEVKCQGRIIYFLASDAGTVMHSDWDRRVVTATHGLLFTYMYIIGALDSRRNPMCPVLLSESLILDVQIDWDKGYVIDPILTLYIGIWVNCMESGRWLHSICCSHDGREYSLRWNRQIVVSTPSEQHWSLITHDRAGGKKSIEYPDQGSIESSGRFSNPPKSNHEKQTNLWFPKKSRFKTLSVSAPAPAPETSALLCDVLGALHDPDNLRENSWSS